MSNNPLAVEVTSCHQRAMVFAQDAYAARMQGRLKIAARLTRKAYDLEKKAADLVAPLLDVEPTRSILHRSAATLALECQEIREAEKLVAAGLAGDPPEEIAEELRDLLERVNFQRHLQLHGQKLSAVEFQFSSGSLRDPVPEIAALAAQMPYRPVLFPEPAAPFVDKGQESGEQEALGWVAELLSLELDGATTVQVRQAIQVAIGRMRDTTDPDALKAAAARGYVAGEQEALAWVAEHCLLLPPFGAGPAAKLREEIEQAALHLRQQPDELLRLALGVAREIGEE